MYHLSKLSRSGKETWIFIHCDEWDFEEPDSFILFLNTYRDSISGKTLKYSKYTQYIVNNDELGLIFQWDDLVGNTVVIPENTDLQEATQKLQAICDKLNAAERQ